MFGGSDFVLVKMPDIKAFEALPTPGIHIFIMQDIYSILGGWFFVGVRMSLQAAAKAMTRQTVTQLAEEWFAPGRCSTWTTTNCCCPTGELNAS
jgi:hypothetical protein